MKVGKYHTKVRKNLQKRNSRIYWFALESNGVSEPYGIRDQGGVVAPVADHVTDDGRTDIGLA